MKPLPEPLAQRVKPFLSVGDRNDDVVYAVPVCQMKAITTAFDHQKGNDQGRPLVSVHEPVVLDKGVQQCCGLSVNCTVITGIRATYCGLDSIEADNA